MQRRRLLILAIPPALAAVGLLSLYLLVKPEKLRPVLEQQLSEALQRPVRVGSLSFGVLPVALAASQVSIGEDARFGEGAFATAEVLRVRPQVLPLLRGNVVVDSLAVEGPKIELRRNAAGTWNYESLGKKSGGESSGLELGELVVREATVGVQKAGDGRSEYQRLGLTVRNYAAGKPFDLELRARTAEGAEMGAAGRVELGAQKTVLRGVALQLAGLQGKLDGEIAGEALALRVEIPSSPIAQAAPLFLPKETSVKGQVSARIEVSGTTNAPRAQGNVVVEGFEASGGKIQQPVRMKRLALELTPERISLLPAAIESGSTQLQLYGVVSQYQTKPMLEATLLAPGARVDELLAIARAYGAVSSGDVEGSGQLRLQVRAHGPLSGDLQFSGNGAIEGARLRVPSLTKPLEVGHADFRFAEDSVALENVTAALGTTKASGSLKLANFRAPRAEFVLRADKIVLAEARGWLKESKDSGKPGKLSAAGSVEIGELDLESLVLQRVAAQCRYRDGHLELDPLRAALYGGTQVGAMDIDMRPVPPVYQLRSKLEAIESAELLAAATAVKGVVSGPLSADLDLRFSPGEAVAMARTLNGKVNLRFDKGRIAGFNLMNEVAAVAKFLGYSGSGEKFTQFLGITGDLAIQNGAASTENLKLELANLTASMTGGMNLAEQTLDLKILSVLDKRFSEQVGGSKIGGFMTAALANAQGNLLIPATIRGTFQKPVMAPDASAMAKLKLQNMNPANPKQVMEQVEGVLGIFRKKK